MRWCLRGVTVLIAIASWTSATPGLSLCGNGLVEAPEECDDGGTCVGGANAGTACASDNQCVGSGVCDGGPKTLTGCVANSDCPSGSCVHCKPFGGDGCAANCTLETALPYTFVPGMLDGIDLLAGTSGAVLNNAAASFGIVLSGTQTLLLGKERNGVVPGVIREDSVRFPRSPIGMFACACARAVAYKTCGGTVFDAGGTTLSTSCTEGYTAGASVCPPDKPCTFVYGAGNAAAGVIGCSGLDGINLSFSQDCNAAPGAPPNDPVIGLSGSGPAGAALLNSTLSISTVIGGCTGSGADYGADGLYCTADDPYALRGSPLPLVSTTGSASGEVFNAGDQTQTLGPFSVSGAPFTCAGLSTRTLAGANLVGAFTSCDQGGADIVVTTSLIAGSAAPVELDIGATSPDLAGKALTEVVLHSHTVRVGAIEHDILFDSTRVQLTSADDCQITAALGDTAPGCTDVPVTGPCRTMTRDLATCGGNPQPLGCPAEAGPSIRRLHVSLFASVVPNTNPLPEDVVLYTCAFSVVDVSRLPATLQNLHVAASAPNGAPIVEVAGVDGRISSPPPLPTETATHTPTATPPPTGTPTATPPPTGTPTTTPPPTGTPTETPPPAHTPTATPTGLPVCAGDCNRDGDVTVDEVLVLLNIALGNTVVDTCRPGDLDHSQQITIDEILTAIHKALNGCP